MSGAFNFIDPKIILVKRDTRQRQENIADISDLRDSIKTIGIINPIVVSHLDGAYTLVAGERRLKASLDLDLKEVPIRFFEDLSESEAEIIELEENVKRKELGWKDQVRAIGRIHLLYKKSTAGWRIEQTAEAVSLHHSQLRKILHVFDALDSGRIERAEGIEQAYNILHRFSERKAESIVGDIIVAGAKLFATAANAVAGAAQAASQGAAALEDSFTTTSAIKVASEGSDELPLELEDTPPPPPPPVISAPPEPLPPAAPILCTNFIEWIKTYNGPKFSLIHCDFPYGNYRGDDSIASTISSGADEFYDNTEDVYWNLMDALIGGLDRIMSYSAHMIFWFNMNFYTETVSRLRKTGLMVHDHPIIWHKSAGAGGSGVVPGTATTYPRRSYDTALLCVRGSRPLAKPGSNSYVAPHATNKIHPSQKPEPMLRFFLSMVVDETTTMFDPTCGSGAALRAAEDLGAKSVLGIEMDENYAKTALTRTLQARVMRQAGQLRKEE